jgi:ribonuclease HI
MKQLNMFEINIAPVALLPKKKSGARWHVYIDGASRKNPGESGAGIYVLKNDMVVFRKGYYLGHKTNNQAEYLALLLGIFYCKKHIAPEDTLYIISDSELLIKQMKGMYKVKNIELRKYFEIACILLQHIQHSFKHVLREKNQEADALANEGIDKRTHPPQAFLTLLDTYEILL